MKKFIAVLVATCQIYTSVIDIVNNMEIIVEEVQSVLVRAEGASVTSNSYGFLNGESDVTRARKAPMLSNSFLHFKQGAGNFKST